MAVVVAVALVPVGVAYLQLGFSGAAAAPTAAVDPVDRAVERAVASVASEVAGTYDWSDRETATAEVRDRLGSDFETIQQTPGDDTVGVWIAFNQSDAQRFASACPRGDGRQFGDCIADGGVVVQDRADETTLVGVAIDITVVGPDQTTELTRRYRAGGRTE